jgi:DNA repair protein RadC
MSKQSYMVKVLRVGECAPSMLIDTPEIACRYWRKVIESQTWFDENKEALVVLLLSTRYYVQGFSLVSIGSLNESIAHPREIFRAAIASGCYGIIVMHNHPSGDPGPSRQDHSLTKCLREAADLLQIILLDHVIVGRRRVALPRKPGRPSRSSLPISRQGYFSFKEAGVL